MVGSSDSFGNAARCRMEGTELPLPQGISCRVLRSKAGALNQESSDMEILRISHWELVLILALPPQLTDA